MSKREEPFGLLDKMPSRVEHDARPVPKVQDVPSVDTRAMQGLNKAQAIELGHRCMVMSNEAVGLAEDWRFVAALQTTGNRMERAVYWATRAQAFYALAAVLPE